MSKKDILRYALVIFGSRHFYFFLKKDNGQHSTDNEGGYA